MFSGQKKKNIKKLEHYICYLLKKRTLCYLKKLTACIYILDSQQDAPAMGKNAIRLLEFD